MSLLWHLVRKDLRRMALPAALWCALSVARALLPWLAMGHGEVDATALGLWDAMLILMLAMEVCVGCILVAALVFEDNVTGTTAWWMTRPISGARLLGAKLLGSGLLLVVAPTVTLCVVWLAAGFSLREMMSAAAWCVVMHSILVVLAQGIAAVAENLAQFLFGSLALVVGLTPFVGYFGVDQLLMLPPPDYRMIASGQEWIACIILLLSAALFLNQFLTRRRQFTIMLLAAGLALIVGFSLGWRGRSRPLTRLGVWDQGVSAVATAADDEVRITLTRLDADDADVAGKLLLRVTGTGGPAQSYVRVLRARGEWRWAGKPGARTYYNRQEEHAPTVRPEAAAAEAIAGLKAGIEPMEWSLSRYAPSAFSNDRIPERPDGFRGEVDLELMRGRLLGELPLRPGAALHAGSSFTRVMCIQHVETRIFAIIEERDALPMRQHWLDLGSLRDRPGEVEDYYVLLDRATNRQELLGRAGFEGLCAGAMVTGQRRLEVPDWAEGATLVKVRFEGDHFFSRPLVADRLPLTTEEKLP